MTKIIRREKRIEIKVHDLNKILHDCGFWKREELDRYIDVNRLIKKLKELKT